jgi:hypothetical protein
VLQSRQRQSVQELHELLQTQTLGNKLIMNVTNKTHFFLWRCDPKRVMVSSFLRFLDHIQRRTTVSRTPLDKRSARRRDLYLTTHNTHNRQTSMPPVGFEPTISAGQRLQTFALHRAVTETDNKMQLYRLIYFSLPALHISGDVFDHRQEHLIVFTVSGSIHSGCCRLVSWMI